MDSSYLLDYVMVFNCFSNNYVNLDVNAGGGGRENQEMEGLLGQT